MAENGPFGARQRTTKPVKLLMNKPQYNMKMRLLSLLLSLFAAHTLAAQSTATHTASTTDADSRKATETLVSKYQLNADQAKQAYQIQQRKSQNMADIAALQASDVALYQAKWHNVQKGTWTSLRRILNTEGQVATYQKTKADLRVLRNAMRKEMTLQKASKETIEYTVLAIYAE